MNKFIISKEVLDAVLGFVNFAVKYKEVPELMAKEIMQLFNTKDAIQPLPEPDPTPTSVKVRALKDK